MRAGNLRSKNSAAHDAELDFAIEELLALVDLVSKEKLASGLAAEWIYAHETLLLDATTETALLEAAEEIAEDDATVELARADEESTIGAAELEGTALLDAADVLAPLQESRQLP